MEFPAPPRFQSLIQFLRAAALIGLLSPGVAGAQAAHARRPAPPSKTPSHEPANAAGSQQERNGAAPGQPTAPKEITAAHLAALPKPLPASLTQGIDVAQRSGIVLAHLSEIIRYYRMCTTPIQKTGEPSDVLYAEQAQATATQIAQLAFQSARDEAALLARIQVMPGAAPAAQPQGEAQRLSAAQLRVLQRMHQLQAQSEAVDKQLEKSRGKARLALEQQQSDIQGQMELLAAESEALAKVSGVSVSQTNSGLQTDIDKLQHSVPEVVDNKVKPVANSLQSIGSMRDAGVTTQAEALFQLLSTDHAIDQRIGDLKKLHRQAEDLRTPLVNILHATLTEGQKLESQIESSSASPNSEGMPADSSAAGIRKQYDQLTDAFKTISGVSVPISQELLLIEQANGNFLSWRAAVETERLSILHSLLLRVVLIALVLAVVFIVGEVWRRAASRYVQDLRRRRQLLVIRRMVIGFLSGIVILLGFITQFSSLTTFAGFITAGIAVALQTVLLSVAAYFFIVGRYGVRVGDRITVANVTGDVVEVGLVRFYMMELAGTGAVLHPTGRIAVFANSVLFQTGTPLYKQIPGTNYAWHEIVVKLKAGVDPEPAMRAVRRAVEDAYASYRAEIERQHAATEAWMDTTIPSPTIETQLQFTDGLQFSVLYPVIVHRAAEADQHVVQKLIETLGGDAAAAQALDGPPVQRTVART
jgi:small-conductance mechanosensitive channel